MEPNFLATPNDSLPDDVHWQALSEPALQPVTLEAGSLAPGDTLTPVSPPHAPPSRAPHTHGHLSSNGHANGHGNGNGMAHWSAAAVSLTAPVVRHAVAVAPAEPQGFYLRTGKRLFDLVGALVGLAFGLPLMGLAAILIKIESRGPVLYKSQRIGFGGRAFTFFKLRSMMDGADRHRHHLSHLNEADGPVFKMTRDPRVTRVGRFLRMTSLDELPQLFNVVRGEMSLVGPRPPIPEEVAQYEPWQLRRLSVKPGLTCLWQISGRSRLGFQEWMRLDLEYIRHQSLAMDLRILIRTIPAVLSREGAY